MKYYLDVWQRGEPEAVEVIGNGDDRIVGNSTAIKGASGLIRLVKNDSLHVSPAAAYEAALRQIEQSLGYERERAAKLEEEAKMIHAKLMTTVG
jgi:hypothetical protein